MTPDTSQAEQTTPAPASSGTTRTSATAQVRPIRFSIRTKMIMVHAALLIAAVGAIGAINAHQARKHIDTYATRLTRTIKDSIYQAGRGQLNLLAATARIALVQSDYGSLKTIVSDVKRKDPRINKVAIIAGDGTVISDVGEPIRPASFVTEVLKLRDPTSNEKLRVGSQESVVFATPVRYGDRLLCTALIGYSLEYLRAELARAEAMKQKVSSTQLRNILLGGLIAGLVGIMLTILQGLRISRPIRQLALQANRIADGDFNARVEISAGDEIGQLGDTFNHMSHQVVSLMEEAQRTAAIEREFEIATTIQSSLVPATSAASLQGLELCGMFRPATQCGGDWWNYYPLADDRTLVVVGDVTGHGVPAAMITAIVKGAASTMVSLAADDDSLSLQTFLNQLNAVVYEAGQREFFMTCFAALYDARTHTVSYANAGHTSPYVFGSNGRSMTKLMAPGTWLGYHKAQSFRINATKLHEEDVIVFYTDGLVEWENAAQEMYGERRLRRLVPEIVTLPLHQLQERIVAEARDFAEGLEPTDDVTVVVGRIGSCRGAAVQAEV